MSRKASVHACISSWPLVVSNHHRMGGNPVVFSVWVHRPSAQEHRYRESYLSLVLRRKSREDQSVLIPTVCNILRSTE